MGYNTTGEEPFHDLFTRPQAHAADVADFALASQVPIWDTLGIPRPSGGAGPENRVLTEIIADNIEHHNAQFLENQIQIGD